MQLAAEVKCGGLILISPFTSVKDLVSEHAGSVLGWLVAEGPDVFASDKYTHKRTHANTRPRMHARTHAHTHTKECLE